MVHPGSGIEGPDAAGLSQQLEQGLAALKQGDYAGAIAPLMTVERSHPNPTVVLRSRQALAVAFDQLGQPAKALPYAQALAQSAQPALKAWGDRTVASLLERYPSLAQAPSKPAVDDPTGFVPLDGSPSLAPDRPANPPGSPEDATGFVPLEVGATPVQPAPPQAARRSRPSPTLPTPSRPQAAPAPPQTAAKAPMSPAPDSAPEIAAPAAPLPRATPAEDEAPAAAPHIWQQAGRAQQWRSLRKAKLGQLWVIQLLSALAFLWLTRWLLALSVEWLYWLSGQFPLLPRFTFLSPVLQQPGQFAWGLVGLMLLALPWAMDALLRFGYGLQTFSLKALSDHSPEATKLLRQRSRQWKVAPLNLGLLPLDAPLIFTYGHLRRTARIVVSQGLLRQLSDDEIAALYAVELGHVEQWSFGLLSGLVLFLQIPYGLYWGFAQVGDRLPTWLRQSPIPAFLRQRSLVAFLQGIAAVSSSLSYGIFWLLRWPLLWLGRTRTYYSDRAAAELTGNPNGLTRALLKMALGMAQTLQQQQKTPYALEAFELLTPLGYRTAATLGSLGAIAPFETALEWERQNPQRRWLALNNAHPPTGDRLQLLSLYAQFWQIDSELRWPALPKPAPAKIPLLAGLSPEAQQRLLQQGMPYFGIFLGLCFAATLWFVGWLSDLLGNPGLAWMAGDRTLLLGCALLGFGLGTILRINPFFPDLPPASAGDRAALPALLSPTPALPIDSRPVRLSGQLLGRPGFSNALGQDLYLQTSQGLIRLHCCSPLGPLGVALMPVTRPQPLLHQPVMVTGWFRRGLTPWIDVEMIRSGHRGNSQSFHPVWSTLLGSAIALWGIYIIYQGG